jgi:hypothetical protein
MLPFGRSHQRLQSRTELGQIARYRLASTWHWQPNRAWIFMVPSISESLLNMCVCGCAIWPCMDLARTAPASTTPRMSCMGCAAAGTPRDERGACLPIDADSRGKMRMPTASRSEWDERGACLPIDADVRRALWIRQTSIQIRSRSDQIEPDQTLQLWRKRLGAKKEGPSHRRRPPTASSGGGRLLQVCLADEAWVLCRDSVCLFSNGQLSCG